MVAYDIADDKRRTRIQKRLESFGDRIQYSIFSCDLNERELVSLQTSITAIIHHREDQVLFADLGPADERTNRRLTTIGKALEPPSRARIV